MPQRTSLRLQRLIPDSRRGGHRESRNKNHAEYSAFFGVAVYAPAALFRLAHYFLHPHRKPASVAWSGNHDVSSHHPLRVVGDNGPTSCHSPLHRFQPAQLPDRPSGEEGNRISAWRLFF